MRHRRLADHLRATTRLRGDGSRFAGTTSSAGVLLPHHQRIDDGDALPFRVHQHRIELDLGNLGLQPRRKHRDLRDQLRQRRNIRFRRAAKSIEQRRRLQARQHRRRFRRTDRRRAIDHVAEQFRGDAAEADHDHRPEGGIRQRADDDLDALFRHRADQHALDRGVGPMLARVVEQRLDRPRTPRPWS